MFKQWSSGISTDIPYCWGCNEQHRHPIAAGPEGMCPIYKEAWEFNHLNDRFDALNKRGSVRGVARLPASQETQTWLLNRAFGGCPN